MRNIFLALALALALLLPLAHSLSAEARVPHSADTVTNVCVVYGIHGVFSGGVRIVAPATMSYHYAGTSGWAFLWLPSGERLRVDSLSVSPLPPDGTCVGIV